MDIYDINFYDFELPAGQIAQHPASPRDESRLLAINRKAESFEDLKFRDIAEMLGGNDVLVVNETKVFPARLFGTKIGTGAQIEVLLLRQHGDEWECLARPAKRLKPGTCLEFGKSSLKAEVIKDLDIAGGKLLRFFGYDDWFAALQGVGKVPLPPYIQRAAELSDESEYQTVYAREWGSAAAPTAGLHFTEDLMKKIELNGTEIVRLVLHVGLGTFRPVDAADIREHKMHREHFEMGAEQALTLNQARREGKRIVAVGTTSVRTLESCYDKKHGYVAGADETGIFIYPGYEFKAVDAMITNFHLPKSSLLMLVYAFGGVGLMRQAYRHAVEQDYRFFSYGDAMFIC